MKWDDLTKFEWEFLSWQGRAEGAMLAERPEEVVNMVEGLLCRLSGNIRIGEREDADEHMDVLNIYWREKGEKECLTCRLFHPWSAAPGKKRHHKLPKEVQKRMWTVENRPLVKKIEF